MTIVFVQLYSWTSVDLSQDYCLLFEQCQQFCVCAGNIPAQIFIQCRNFAGTQGLCTVMSLAITRIIHQDLSIYVEIDCLACFMLATQLRTRTAF